MSEIKDLPDRMYVALKELSENTFGYVTDFVNRFSKPKLGNKPQKAPPTIHRKRGQRVRLKKSGYRGNREFPISM
jgi:hypothetical protein